MNKAYSRINWENYPSTETPVNEQNLNKMDGSMDEIDNRVISLDTIKFDKTEAQGLIKNVTFDLQKGILKKYYYNGSTEEINTGISKLNMNLRFDKESQILYIVNADGTEDPIDLSVFITNYEFEDSDTIAHNVSSDGIVTSIVKNGSITENKLQPNYLADIKVEVARAESAATAADASKTSAAGSASTAATKAGEAATSATNAANSATSADASKTSAAASAATATNKAGEAATSAADAANSKTAAATSATNAANSASTATTKANAAANSATAAETSATSADTYAKQAQSYAVGTGGVRPNEATDSAKYYYEQSRDISQGLAGALIPMGTVAFANLPLLANVESGWMYNISDEFTTDSTFKEGVGRVIPAGSNVYKTADGFWDVLAGSPVTGVKGNAEDSYRKGNVNITPGNIGAINKDGDTMTGKLHAYGGLAVNETTTGFSGNPPYLLGIDSHADGGTVHYKETADITVGHATKATQDENGNNIANTYLTQTGDSANNTVTFTSNDNANPSAWTNVALLSTGEGHSSLFSKISTMFKNVRYLYKMLGTADISAIGDGTVKGALNSLNTSFTTPVASMPYGGYPISDDSYVMRNKFGQVDIFFNVTANVAPAVQNSWHTVAFVSTDYQPDNYRALNCLAINTTTLEHTTVSCFVYNGGNINVNIYNLSDAQYVFVIRGSYFVN